MDPHPHPHPHPQEAPTSSPPPQQPPLSTADHAIPPSTLPQPLSPRPSYTEMIMSAIMYDNSQGKCGGSSKRAISKYIDRVYSELPPTHSALLTHHLIRLKDSGQLAVVGKSYQLPGFKPPPSPLGPPRTRAQFGGMGNELNGLCFGKRPTKEAEEEEEEESNVGGGKRGRGWPKGKLRGPRPRPRGRPRGSSRKYSVLVKDTSEHGQETTKEDLLRKLEDMQSKIRDAVEVIRPYIADQSTSDALSALQELEELANVNATASPAVTEPLETESPETTMPLNLTTPSPACATSAAQSSDAPTCNLTAPPNDFFNCTTSNERTLTF
ncbi:hypothetical protein vseg_009279 [Gypsophila vaccaria]